MEYKEQDGTTQLMIIPTTSVYAVCVSHAVAYFTGYEAWPYSAVLCRGVDDSLADPIAGSLFQAYDD